MESGTRVFRSRFNITDRKIFDAEYYKLYPVFAKFVLPGDIWKINVSSLIRYQPLMAPSLTPCQARIRFFFVPLRLLEEKTEFIITGSEDGYFNSSKTVPKFPVWETDAVYKGSLMEQMLGVPVNYVTNTTAMKAEASAPARYWRDAYYRIWWDYYRDENINTASAQGKFETWLSGFSDASSHGGVLMSANLPHDYFTKSLPWQLKGIAPAMSFSVSGFSWNGVTDLRPGPSAPSDFSYTNNIAFSDDSVPGGAHGLSGGYTKEDDDIPYDDINSNIQRFLNNISGNINGAFTMADLRDLSAQTRVFERLARCGSRYTEYLRANFATSPADETLQRSQYLGGVKIPIVVTEVPQVAGAVNSDNEQTPVGTMRGKGISAGGGSIKTHHFKEFGCLVGIFDVRPAMQYCQGLPREYTYKTRFDFFNPSFQHLSEQEVRKSEIYAAADTYNDDTFGFQAYANELRTGHTSIVGNMRDTLNFWHQALIFNSRPSLNEAFLKGTNHYASWNRCFEVVENTQPMIVDLGFPCIAHRPMVRYGTPGLVDHL